MKSKIIFWICGILWLIAVIMFLIDLMFIIRNMNAQTFNQKVTLDKIETLTKKVELIESKFNDSFICVDE